MIIGMMMCLIVVMTFALGQFIAARHEIGEIRAEGIEKCYGLDCDVSLLGGVKCYIEHVPEPDIKVFGGDLNGTLGS